jgi:hypothetical protein
LLSSDQYQSDDPDYQEYRNRTDGKTEFKDAFDESPNESENTSEHDPDLLFCFSLFYSRSYSRKRAFTPH